MIRCAHCHGAGFTRDQDGIPVCIACARPLHQIVPLPLLRDRTNPRSFPPQACVRCGAEFQPKNGTQRYCAKVCADLGHRIREALAREGRTAHA